jgi:hypothetical protein
LKQISVENNQPLKGAPGGPNNDRFGSLLQPHKVSLLSSTTSTTTATITTTTKLITTTTTTKLKTTTRSKISNTKDLQNPNMNLISENDSTKYCGHIRQSEQHRGWLRDLSVIIKCDRGKKTYLNY